MYGSIHWYAITAIVVSMLWLPNSPGLCLFHSLWEPALGRLPSKLVSCDDFELLDMAPKRFTPADAVCSQNSVLSIPSEVPSKEMFWSYIQLRDEFNNVSDDGKAVKEVRKALGWHEA